MMFCQLAQAKSLREISDGLACCDCLQILLESAVTALTLVCRSRGQLELIHHCDLE
jgi:hypothetical protein